MTAQEKIRVGVAIEIFKEMGKNLISINPVTSEPHYKMPTTADWDKLRDGVKEYWLSVTDKVHNYQHSQGVVIKGQKVRSTYSKKGGWQLYFTVEPLIENDNLFRER